MKRMLIIFSIALIGFIAFDIIYSSENKVNLTDNPYKKLDLHPETIKLLDNENYKNIILPNKVDKLLHNKKDVIVYFFSPTCIHCQRITPIIVPMAEKMDIELVLFNLLEFRKGWDDYDIEKTPTLVQYDQGHEISRIEGAKSKREFKKWFNHTTK